MLSGLELARIPGGLVLFVATKANVFKLHLIVTMPCHAIPYCANDVPLGIVLYRACTMPCRTQIHVVSWLASL